MSVVIKSLAPARVAFVRHVGPYDRVAPAWDRLCAFLGKEGLLGGDSQFFGICHDDPAVTEGHGSGMTPASRSILFSFPRGRSACR